MELDDFKSAWLSSNEKLEARIKLNEQSIKILQTQKVESRLSGLYRQRIIELIFHSMAIILLVGFIIQNRSEFPYAISALALLAFYITTFINALRQVNLIRNLDYSRDLASIQSDLVKLQTHIINFAKLSILFIPTFLAYPVILTRVIKDYHIKAMADFDIITKSNGNWWIAEMVCFIIMIPLGIWFYNEVSYKNMHKKWVKRHIEQFSSKRVTKALEFLNELEAMQKD